VCPPGYSILDGTGYGRPYWVRGESVPRALITRSDPNVFIEELNMKKLVLALSAVAALTAPALAADMAAKAPLRAAPVAYAPSWTGCYVGGGGGYGLWNQENTLFDNTTTPRTQVTRTTTEGGRGYFGTVQGGCDYQFPAMGTSFVVGAFGDYDFSSLKADISPGGIGFFGQEKMSSAWSVGGRVGWVALPGLLTYFSGGYTEATFDRVNLSNAILFAPSTTIAFFDKHTYKGWFLGAGDEYALTFLPGLFWKTEYRFSEFDRGTNVVRNFPAGTPFGLDLDSKKFVHTVRSELVYRFNWGGPLVAKY
jgi:outer membrane immunogenic protein